MKRGGTVNIVNHTVELEADVEHIPQFIEVDVSKLEINSSVHLADVALPKGVKALRADQTLVTVVPPSGYGEEQKAAAAAPAAGAAAPAAGAAAPAAAKAPAGGDKKK